MRRSPLGIVSALLAAGLAGGMVPTTSPASPATIFEVNPAANARALSTAPGLESAFFGNLFSDLGLMDGRFRRLRVGPGFVKHRAPGERAHRRWRHARASGLR